MHFTKMQGAGNDYVYVDCTHTRVPEPSKTAREISDRHYGIGSDGLILILPSDKADFRMGMYNADGSESAMCGNGIRCVGKYVYDHGLTDRTQLRIETGSGIRNLTLQVEDGKVRLVRVDMGEPILQPERIPVKAEGLSRVIDAELLIAGKVRRCTCVSVGNPHAVFFISEDVRQLDLEKIGPAIETDAIFPERVNAEFVNVLPDGKLRMRVWERGTGETLACGTGACAVGIAAALTKRTGRSVEIAVPGGTLFVDWDEKTNHVYLTGDAVEVFEGEINV